MAKNRQRARQNAGGRKWYCFSNNHKLHLIYISSESLAKFQYVNYYLVTYYMYYISQPVMTQQHAPIPLLISASVRSTRKVYPYVRIYLGVSQTECLMLHLLRFEFWRILECQELWIKMEIPSMSTLLLLSKLKNNFQITQPLGMNHTIDVRISTSREAWARWRIRRTNSNHHFLCILLGKWTKPTSSTAVWAGRECPVSWSMRVHTSEPSLWKGKS